MVGTTGERGVETKVGRDVIDEEDEDVGRDEPGGGKGAGGEDMDSRIDPE